MQQIKNDINKPVALGFMAILALMFSLVFVSLVQLHSINESMQKMVEVTHISTAAANDVRNAIRLKSEGLMTMQLTSSRNLLLALAGIALLFSLLLARTVITRLSSKNTYRAD
ncbi:MAG: hypothetical protein JRG79_20965 [Deltaproteobacteria bacterium]|nr:hypothetical protein [Deltaproteobacteria bacterium]